MPHLSVPLVVFLDELDLLHSLEFPHDDFLASISTMKSLRQKDNLWNGLTFCLITISLPADLLADPDRPPFAPEQTLFLEDFTPDEAEGFLTELGSLQKENPWDPTGLLGRIYYWTKGHPYMTQCLCQKRVEEDPKAESNEEDWIDNLVWTYFLKHEGSCDILLSYMQQQLYTYTQEERRELLGLYQKLLDGKAVLFQEESWTHQTLRLWGLASRQKKEEQVLLRIRNRIIEETFKQQWLRQHLPLPYQPGPMGLH